MRKINIELKKVAEDWYDASIYVNDKLLCKTKGNMFSQIRKIIKERTGFRIPYASKLCFDSSGMVKLDNYSPITVKEGKVIYG